MTDRINRPIIGVVPSFDEGENVHGGSGLIKRVFLRREYLDMLARAGAVPLIISPELELDHIMDLCDGIVISGGQDIDPEFYGEDRLPEVQKTEPHERFEWESQLIAACDKMKMPILGICYGLQRLNVYYGGSLIQDIPTEIGTKVRHDNVEHEVIFTENFLGFLAGEKKVIASRHHQAVARLAPGFDVCATAADGVIEAIKRDRCFGMQWHPESDITGIHVYHAFVEQCMKGV